MKTCKTCEHFYPDTAVFWPPSSRSADELHWQCKACFVSRAAAHRAAKKHSEYSFAHRAANRARREAFARVRQYFATLVGENNETE